MRLTKIVVYDHILCHLENQAMEGTMCVCLRHDIRCGWTLIALSEREPHEVSSRSVAVVDNV